MTQRRHVWKLYEGCIHITLDNRFSREENGVSFASRVAPVPSSDSVDSPPRPSTTAWNSWALPKVAWNLAHQKLEFLNRNFLPFFCLFAMLHPRSRPHLTPVFRKDEAPSHLRCLAKRSFQNERLSDLFFHLALCVPSIRNENRLICRRTRE